MTKETLFLARRVKIRRESDKHASYWLVNLSRSLLGSQCVPPHSYEMTFDWRTSYINEKSILSREQR